LCQQGYAVTLLHQYPLQFLQIDLHNACKMVAVLLLKHVLCVYLIYFRSDFHSLPFQATECCLAHVKPVNGKSAGIIVVLKAVADLLFANRW